MAIGEIKADSSRKRLAIISTYNENCGNASYTHVLKNAFSRYVDVDVIGLDLFLLQSTAPSVRAAGDRHIEHIASRLNDYDFVNVQFEAGLYGASIRDMLRRVTKLIDAAPNLIFTMHRVEYSDESFWKAVRLGVAARSYRRFKSARGSTQFSRLTASIVDRCRKAARTKNLWIKVHTRRDRRVLNEIFEFDKVFDFPLAFLTDEEQQAAQAVNDRASFLKRHGFDPEDKIIGLFGYLSNYKGIETAIEALAKLPSEYKLALFGSQHPQTVKRGEPVSPYLQSLFDLLEGIESEARSEERRAATIDWLRRRDRSGGTAVNVQSEESIDGRRIAERVRFIGSLPDPEFIEALRLSDAVVLPYQEVGQSMSGVVVLGMEAGGRLICSNNHSFFETAKYYRDCFVGFDMGNSIELSQKIIRCATNPEEVERTSERKTAFSKFNIEKSIQEQLGRFGFIINQESK